MAMTIAASPVDAGSDIVHAAGKGCRSGRGKGALGHTGPRDAHETRAGNARRERNRPAHRLAVALAAMLFALALGTAPTGLAHADDGGFDDVSGHWESSEGWLPWVVGQGLMSGYSGTSHFGPNDDLTRAQAVTILYRFANPGGAQTTEPAQYAENSTALPDNQSRMYYTAAVNWAVAEGVVTGYRNSTGEYYAFGPDDPISREQLATILRRFAESEGLGAVYDGSRYLAAPDARRSPRPTRDASPTGLSGALHGRTRGTS